MRRSLSQSVGMIGLLVLMCGECCSAETFEGQVGMEQTKVVSSSYQTSSISGLELSATYTRPMFSRWSFLAQYQTNMNNTLSAGILGIVFDSADLRTKGGMIGGDGTAEVTKTPIWLFRTSVGFGIFKYVDVLRSNNTALGTKNEVPVQADLYGLKLGGTLVRLMGDNWGVTGALTYSVASAKNFGISSNCLSLGAFYRTD